MTQYFKTSDSLFTITENHPETISLFVSKGFPQMEDEKMRALFGKSISLENALKMKKINVDNFSELLNEIISQKENSADISLNENAADGSDLKIAGLLPCPVRIPLVESLDSFLEDYHKKSDQKVVYELQAASMGTDWLVDDIKKAKDDDDLADIYLSAGFDLFFDKELIGKFKDKGVFEDFTGLEKYNTIFDNDSIDLKDPKRHYSMIAVVPAIFLVNKDELGDREVPKTWADILKPEFEKSVSLPVSDFDLFNAMLLHLHQKFGEEGVAALGRSLLESMHPAQMIKSEKKKNDKPAITIMPYFFTKMVFEGSSLIAVWPEDGAIISPIFMLSKSSKKEQLKPITDLFLSTEVAEILAHKGLFPSIVPEIDNKIPEKNTFMWLGWDYIYSHDIGALIKKLDAIFVDSIKEG